MVVFAWRDTRAVMAVEGIEALAAAGGDGNGYNCDRREPQMRHSPRHPRLCLDSGLEGAVIRSPVSARRPGAVGAALECLELERRRGLS